MDGGRGTRSILAASRSASTLRAATGRMQPLERKLAHVRDLYEILDHAVDGAANQDLPVCRFARSASTLRAGDRTMQPLERKLAHVRDL